MYHGPCAKLNLTYICNTTPDVIEIDIDIAPGIAFPDKMYIPPVLETLTHLHPNEFLQTLKELCDKQEIFVVPFDFDTTEKIGESSWTYKYFSTVIPGEFRFPPLKKLCFHYTVTKVQKRPFIDF